MIVEWSDTIDGDAGAQCFHAGASRATPGRFALLNGPICRVCACGKPSAQQTDPIIGLSQKRIKLTSLPHCRAGHVDLAGKGS